MQKEKSAFRQVKDEKSKNERLLAYAKEVKKMQEAKKDNK